MSFKEFKEYIKVHRWVYKTLGKPTSCEHCDKTGLVKWQINWANLSGKYLYETTDWKRLCSSCHVKHDNKNGVQAI